MYNLKQASAFCFLVISAHLSLKTLNVRVLLLPFQQLIHVTVVLKTMSYCQEILKLNFVFYCKDCLKSSITFYVIQCLCLSYFLGLNQEFLMHLQFFYFGNSDYFLQKIFVKFFFD